MKFLLNMNMPRQLGRLLATQGHEWRHVADLGLHKAADPAILGTARETGEVILTHDLDYGTLLAFSGDTKPSVVIFRRRNIHPEMLFEAMTRHWQEWEPALAVGAIIILEERL